MAARRYPTAELYEERKRDFRNGGRSEYSYDELDIDVRGGDPRRSAPDFLRDDYGRTTSGALVVRGEGPSRRREVEEDTLVIRGGGGRPHAREREEDITIRRGERESRPRPREVNKEETDITIRHRDASRPRPREPEREEIRFRHGEIGSPRPREVEREEITFRRGEREPPRPREVDREEVIFRERERERNGREREFERDTVVIRPRDRSLPPPRELVAREREEFVVRRRDPAPRDEVKDEIIIRRTEQRSPSPVAPPPPPEPEPIVRPPIIQEVITHHRHIDHGVERARSLSPPPLPPSPPREDNLEISIRRQSKANGRVFDEDIIYERETRERKERGLEVERTRRRSLSTPRRRYTENDLEAEAEYYNRKAAERAYVGEAYNGATKDWAIVDVPPGTNRVRMDGAGGGSQEITWQRYNGVRRSKFITDDEEFASDFGRPALKPKSADMWTEITKDLVIKEAIDHMGFDYEETDYFFYVMDYLRYEDVLKLVELSDDIRADRRSRVRQIEYEREEIRERKPRYDDRYYEHEVSYDSRRSRYR
ncbi:hypothetical protein AOQ84DRAFT_393458 [Glonium stellatum]|uniref:DUF8035 domain-containing protein n=1 Tax=Glonium stellatum TaxID=574774 RepID=A0A8E2JM31_9PEZI|nr:hypothetical protein AOQ84DRAFT_393458 [Glonium stellatum]